MKNLDLNSLSLEELQRLEALARITVAEREERERRALMRSLAEFAERAGISLDELYEQSVSGASQGGHRAGNTHSSASRRRIEPKYQHPTGQQTWSGRGKQPIWVREYLAAGNTLADLLIVKDAAQGDDTSS